jgi:predicted GNAT family N-acyltransferase
MIRVEKFKTDNTDLANKTFAIREEVFVTEQCVKREEEYDNFEDESTHFIAFDDDKPVATARWRETEKGVKLERFAVLKPYRRKGFGDAILHEVLKDVKPFKKKIYLHAQLTAVKFYEKNGFEKEGDVFEEANILHYRMFLKD